MAAEDTGDKKLIEEFKTSDDASIAFTNLLHKYHKRTYWHVRRIVINHDDADDVVQNTFIKVWENLHNFREDSKLFTWIFRIATNEALLFLNKKKSKFNVSLDSIDANLLENLKSGSYFNGTKAEMELQKAILSLPEKQRLVFNMKYYSNLKYEEMQEILGTSVGALKASYHHAVKKIENYLTSD